jgi:positive regulator of sigma E activity
VSVAAGSNTATAQAAIQAAVPAGSVRSDRVLPASDALVELDESAGCGSCSKGRGCGIVLLPAGRSRVQIPCQNNVGARPGDRVTVALAEPDANWLWMVLAAYGLPTLGLTAGSLLGVAGAALGLAGGLLAGSRISRSLAVRAEASLRPRDARIVSLYQARRV